MFLTFVLSALSWAPIAASCKYITHQSRSFELDTCSYSSYTANISWGFYCEAVNDSLIAVYRQWHGVGCPEETEPSLQLYEIPCNGADDSCDCVGFGGVEQDCSIATMILEGCTDYKNQTVTKYVTNLCRVTGEDTSQNVVCDGGNGLRTMSYENEECDGYGFGINDGEFDVECGYIICKSSSKCLGAYISFVIVILTLWWN